MTAQTRSTLSARFENGDVPQGYDYVDFLDSFVSLLDTSQQTLSGALYSGEFISPKVSAQTLTANSVSIVGTVSCNAVNTAIVSATNTYSTALTVETVVSCDTVKAAIVGSVVVSATEIQATRIIHPVAIVSAAGTVQGTATDIVSTIARIQGVTDGSATGVRLQTPQIGRVQYIVNETAASANVWPNSGCTINGLVANAALGIAANTGITIVHTNASAYRTV